ncbi:MAG: nucleotide exchange factor GrpE [Gammaproteobacteria bacterium]|nr:nucleotide exchange factor GrpE [Gammaproteobacteria bacterium]
MGEEESNIDQKDRISPEIDDAVEKSALDMDNNIGDDANKEESEGRDEQADLEKVTLLLEDARNKADEHWDQCLRLKADIENLHRRHERELEKAHKFALDNFTQELLPVVDSLEFGLNAVNEDNVDVVKLLTEGSELTLKLLKTALGKFGIKEVNPIGEAFNPEIHQAMSIQESDKVSPNTVLAVYQKGYLLNERVVRPAMVVVAKQCQSEQAVADNYDDNNGDEKNIDSTLDSTLDSNNDKNISGSKAGD